MNRQRRNRLGLRDLANQAAAGLSGRASRTALTASGVAIGVAAFVATVGLTSTASNQISLRFDALKATQVTAADTTPEQAPPVDPTQARRRLVRIDGVNEAGVWWTIGSAEHPVSNPPIAAITDAIVVAAGPGALEAMRASFSNGGGFQQWHHDNSADVAIVGRALADQLGIGSLAAPRAVTIGTSTFTVVGVIDDLDRQPELLLAAIVPADTATQRFVTPADDPAVLQVVVDTDIGAAQVVGSQVAVALVPADPTRFTVNVPPDPAGLRQVVSSDLTQLLLLMSAVSLVIGAFGIANTTLVSVLERSAEIGLRRALGARRSHIRWQFITESAATGTLGGIGGALVGLTAVVAVSAVNNWAPVIPSQSAIAAPAIGTLTGLVAGVYPAGRAARIEPLEALRS